MTREQQDHAVDARSATGFVEPVAGKKRSDDAAKADQRRVKAALKAINDARVAAGFGNIDDLSVAVGVAPRTWHNWVSQKKPTSPKLADIWKYADRLGLEVRIGPRDLTASAPAAAARFSHDASEVASLVDDISDPDIRSAVVERIRARIPTMIADETSKVALARKKGRSPQD